MSSKEMTLEWQTILANQIDELEHRTGVPITQWRTAGRKTKAKPAGEDLAFWETEGLRQVEMYGEWLAKSGWQIATMPDGHPGIEWKSETSFGGSPVRVIVDCIYKVGDDFVVVDYKTGSRTPFGMIQMGLYASAVERVYGIRPKWGAFFMTRKGELSDLTDLSPWSMEYFDYGFSAMNATIETGYFPPNVTDACSYCSFSDYCVAVNGSKSANYPLVKLTKEK